MGRAHGVTRIGATEVELEIGMPSIRQPQLYSGDHRLPAPRYHEWDLNSTCELSLPGRIGRTSSSTMLGEKRDPGLDAPSPQPFPLYPFQLRPVTPPPPPFPPL